MKNRFVRLCRAAKEQKIHTGTSGCSFLECHPRKMSCPHTVIRLLAQLPSHCPKSRGPFSQENTLRSQADLRVYGTRPQRSAKGSTPERSEDLSKQRNKEPQAPFGTWGSSTLAMSYSRTTYRCTTIGAAAFHFRVRNGNGWSHCARITRRLAKPKLARGGRGAVSLQLHQKFWGP